MRDLNVGFSDLYKQVDRFIKDAYSSQEGVSEYIRQMESLGYRFRAYVGCWDKDYKMLKHVRWIRNQLSHEVSYDSDICGEDDYDWLASFSARLYSANDPISVGRRAVNQRYEEMQKTRREASEGRTEYDGNNYGLPMRQEKPLTFLQRLKKLFFG